MGPIERVIEEARPSRIRRSRAAGWTMPRNTVYVGRGTEWGNPWKVGNTIATATDAVADVAGGNSPGDKYFREFVITPDLAVALYRIAFGPDKDDARRKFAGKNLACWCPLDQPCHADVLLEWANGAAS